MHGGSGNHGCEAIVRTTATMLGGPENVMLWTLVKQEDEVYGTAAQMEKLLVSEELKRFSPGYFEALFKRRLLKQPDANMKVFLKETFWATSPSPWAATITATPGHPAECRAEPSDSEALCRHGPVGLLHRRRVDHPGDPGRSGSV